jgi:hypothetical protein
MVSQDMKQRLQKLSNNLGMTESALVAYIVGQWVYTQEAVQGKVFDVLNGPEMVGIIKAVTSEGTEADRP